MKGKMNFSGGAWSCEFWLTAIATYNASMTMTNTIGTAIKIRVARSSRAGAFTPL